MRETGLRIALATSADREDLTRLKRIAQIEDLVEEETASNDAEKSKPHPDIFQAALAMLQAPPSEAMALGDTPWDIEAAKKGRDEYCGRHERRLDGRAALSSGCDSLCMATWANGSIGLNSRNLAGRRA